jgi:hypothetical protein
MRIRTLVQTGLVAAMLAGGGVAVFAAPAQAERIDYCDSERINPHYFRMDYWLNQARWLENNGGSDAAIENAYYQYMVASDAYNAAVDAYC